MSATTPKARNRPKRSLADKIPASVPKVYNFDFKQVKIKNPFDSMRTDEKEEIKVVH